jgi:hypothetical protein
MSDDLSSFSLITLNLDSEQQIESSRFQSGGKGGEGDVKHQISVQINITKIEASFAC